MGEWPGVFRKMTLNSIWEPMIPSKHLGRSFNQIVSRAFACGYSALWMEGCFVFEKEKAHKFSYLLLVVRYYQGKGNVNVDYQMEYHVQISTSPCQTIGRVYPFSQASLPRRGLHV